MPARSSSGSASSPDDEKRRRARGLRNCFTGKILVAVDAAVEESQHDACRAVHLPARPESALGQFQDDVPRPAWRRPRRQLACGNQPPGLGELDAARQHRDLLFAAIGKRDDRRRAEGRERPCRLRPGAAQLQDRRLPEEALRPYRARRPVEAERPAAALADTGDDLSRQLRAWPIHAAAVPGLTLQTLEDAGIDGVDGVDERVEASEKRLRRGRGAQQLDRE